MKYKLLSIVCIAHQILSMPTPQPFGAPPIPAPGLPTPQPFGAPPIPAPGLPTPQPFGAPPIPAPGLPTPQPFGAPPMPAPGLPTPQPFGAPPVTAPGLPTPQPFGAPPVTAPGLPTPQPFGAPPVTPFGVAQPSVGAQPKTTATAKTQTLNIPIGYEIHIFNGSTVPVTLNSLIMQYQTNDNPKEQTITASINQIVSPKKGIGFTPTIIIPKLQETSTGTFEGITGINITANNSSVTIPIKSSMGVHTFHLQNKKGKWTITEKASISSKKTSATKPTPKNPNSSAILNPLNTQKNNPAHLAAIKATTASVIAKTQNAPLVAQTATLTPKITPQSTAGIIPNAVVETGPQSVAGTAPQATAVAKTTPKSAASSSVTNLLE